MPETTFIDEVGAIALLDEPVRRALYAYVAGRRTPASRDQAAKAAKISRALAAFHLDKLVAAGFLEVSFRRPAGRRGPGAGRPTKWYHGSARELELSLPARRYKLAAELLAEGLDSGRGADALRAARRAAYRFGRGLGAEVSDRVGTGATRSRWLRAAESALRACGYEPESNDSAICLTNCPFHAVATRHRRVVCAMNFSLLDGFASGVLPLAVTASRDARDGDCCVTLAFRSGGR